MRIGNRSLAQVLSAIFQLRHYRALIRSFTTLTSPLEGLHRYLLGGGEYPFRIGVRTPIGLFHPELYSYHDLLTVNEIFCRGDYHIDSKERVIVDIGSNIGLSALYFMTRNQLNRCYLFEPNPENVKKLHHNLSGFENRFLFSSNAVADCSGLLEFGVEGTGRYGGLDVKTGKYITVNCLEINEVIKDVLNEGKRIDVLKLDIEGKEIATINAIQEKYYESIDLVLFEESEKDNLKKLTPALLERYCLKSYGWVRKLQRHP